MTPRSLNRALQQGVTSKAMMEAWQGRHKKGKSPQFSFSVGNLLLLGLFGLTSCTFTVFLVIDMAKPIISGGKAPSFLYLVFLLGTVAIPALAAKKQWQAIRSKFQNVAELLVDCHELGKLIEVHSQNEAIIKAGFNKDIHQEWAVAIQTNFASLLVSMEKEKKPVELHERLKTIFIEENRTLRNFFPIVEWQVVMKIVENGLTDIIDRPQAKTEITLSAA